MKTEHKSHTPKEIRDLWMTPKFVFDYYDRRFNFKTDLAASDKNHLCDHYYTESNSAFNAEVGDFNGAVFCNPPYSDIMPWVTECVIKSELTGKPFVMLIPADTSVKWFKVAFDNCSEGHFISGRLSFVNAETQKPVNGNNKGSVVFIFDSLSPLKSQVALIDRESMK